MKDELLFEITTQALALLLENLPLHAQEGHYRTAVPRETLTKALQAVLSRDAAECLVAVAERMLRLAATLDTQALQRGDWCFVSFPASLCAVSLLLNLAETDRALFPADFWETSPYQHDNTLSAQHQVLSWLESRRVENHPCPLPSRACAVSAGVIRLAGKFWLHRRESRYIRDGNGDYVLPGGRSVYADLEVLPGLSPAERLRMLNEASRLPSAVHEQTLKRELQEEIGLLHGRDYTFASIRSLPVRHKLSGASSNFSYTRYHFTLFNIELSWEGFFKLFRAREAAPGQFAEFNLEELRAGKNGAGQTAYLDILDDIMDEAADSLQPAYRFSAPAQAVTLPLDASAPLRQGNTRHETIMLEAGRLNLAHCRLLWLLGAHAKGAGIVPCQGVELLPYGWVRLDRALHEIASELAEQLRHTRLLEIAVPDYMRLSVDPAYIFFDDRQFSFDVQDEQRKIKFVRHGLDMGWATLQERALTLPLSNNRLLVAIRALLEGEKLSFTDPRHRDLESLARAVFEKDGQLATLGLRKFLRIENNRYRIAIRAEPSASPSSRSPPSEKRSLY